MLFSDTLSAWVTIEGERCSEYAFASSDDDKHVSCWIASEAGKSFQIHFKDTPVVPMKYSLKIDGQSCQGKVIRAPNGLPYTRTVEGRNISATMQRPFMFSPINLSDDESLLLNSVNGIGDIVLSVCPGIFSPSTKQYSGVPAKVNFHERMKKGIDHQTSFGAPTIVKASTRYSSHLIGTQVTLTYPVSSSCCFTS